MNIERLPNEIMANIFRYVEPGDIHSCLIVSTRWQALIKATLLNSGSKASRISELKTSLKRIIERKSQCEEEDYVKAKALLEIKELDLDIRFRARRHSLLSGAIYHGKLGIARLLLQRADLAVNAEDTDGYSAIHVASILGAASLVPLITGHSSYLRGKTAFNSYTSIHLAAIFNNAEVIRGLSDAGDCPADALDGRGRNALHCASLYGHLETCRALIEHCGADPNLRTRSGRSPLLLACNMGRANIVEYLTSVPEVDVNSKMLNGLTPLLVAAFLYADEQPAVADILLACPRVDLEDRCFNGLRAIEIAKVRGKHGLVRKIAEEELRREQRKAGGGKMKTETITASDHGSHPYHLRTKAGQHRKN